MLFCSAYQANDIADFERILRENQRTIMEDPFIREHVEGTLVGWAGQGGAMSASTTDSRPP